jgi:glutamate dehydrogenase
MPAISHFFHESFSRSLSSIYKDFYSPEELNFLEKELWSTYNLSSDHSSIHTVSYRPSTGDPLIRLNMECILISCPSTPFFAAKIRSIFHSREVPINRSIHFHPNSGEELYYIEIQTSNQDFMKQLILDIESAFHRITKFTKDFPLFHNRMKKISESHTGDVWSLLHWLIEKGMIWEGGIFVEGEQHENFGDLSKASDYVKWFTSIPSRGKEFFFQALESHIPCFLSEGTYFYIAFIHENFRLLLQGSFSQYAQSLGINEIPYFNTKFHRFLEVEKVEYKSGLGRTIRRIFNSLPVETLFLMEDTAYIDIYKVILEQSLKTQNRANGIMIHKDLALILTAIPEKNWSEEKWLQTSQIIKAYLPTSTHKLYHSLLSNSIQGYHLIRSQKLDKQVLFQISSEIEFHFRPWVDYLRSKWEDRYKEEPFPGDLHFEQDYISTHDPEKAIYDLYLATNLRDNRVIFSVSKTEASSTLIQAITKDNEYPLSHWVSAFTSFGLSPLSQRVYRFSMKGKSLSKIEFFFEEFQDLSRLYHRLKVALTYTMVGVIPSDSLSGLILKTHLDVNGVYFIKSIRDYCLQTNPSFNKSDFNEILLQHPEFCWQLWDYFYAKFLLGTPKNPSELKSLSDEAKTLREDEVLNSMRTAVLAIVRTNFFGTNLHEKFQEQIGVDREAVAYKIDSSIPVSLPNPRPYREIFVYSSWFQGIHLRGGSVARGGIRFSDRPSDFRTEILSLMKTQMVKNTVIVPVGSKGGFVLTKNQYLQKEIPMVEAYKAYIRSLLYLTDNRKGSQRITFEGKLGPFAYDEFDPYLVVAADKGTAQLSDTANEISIAFGYWLGDAFASGGSRGYSHKEYGITAKGALVTADRHLRNLGIDYQLEPVTVVGIGDMGGDVFGNGLINSKAFQLVAVFNHKHIFLDPNPDPMVSYEERKRLFFSKSSGWDSYDKKLISKGGGVYDKSEKAIPISPEVKEVLGIEEDVLSGPALISAILKAPVDLLYNGGIGTYVKSSEEDNSKVGDPSNNDVRINGNDLRARVVCEGGNLGFTQLGRIEYDLKGGRIYTDALDNSAGVDLSDHEVNLKIFFRYLQESHKIQNEDERDLYMKKIALEVCDSVLLDNALQSLSIEADSYDSSIRGWNKFIYVTKYMVDKKLLNPFTEKVPSNSQEWEQIQEQSSAIPRPILCVLLSYVKMDLYAEAMRKEIFTVEEFPDLYYSYFPKSMVDSYRSDLLQHPLKKEILNTQIVNFYVNFMGVGGLHILIDGKLDLSKKLESYKKIVKFLYEHNIHNVISEVALLRDKKVEQENTRIISELRERVYSKWGASKNVNLQGYQLSNILSPLVIASIENL